MNILSYENENATVFSNRTDAFFRRFRVGDILRKCNAYKEKGIPALAVFLYLFHLVFRNRSVYLDMQVGKSQSFAKDTVYRFKNSIRIQWMKFTTLLASAIIREAIDPLTSKDRRSAFVVDDSVFERPKSKTVELLAKVFDHAHHKYLRGFRMLTLGWSDGVTFIPVNSCLLSSENKQNRYNEAEQFKSNSYAAEIRRLAQSKGTDVVLYLIDRAQEFGVLAKYVLFDSWFTSPKMIRALKDRDLDTVAMVKKADNMLFMFRGNLLSVKSIYNSCKKRRGRAKYLLSVDIEVAGETPIPAKLVYVRNRNDRQKYLVLICTDVSLSEKEIIELYGKRWDIEVFFKTCKSVLNLTGECRSLSYDSMCAQTAIVFTRYMFMAVAIREEKDARSAGPLFCLVCDEMADISFSYAMKKLQLFLDNLSSLINSTDADIHAVIVAFLADLPEIISKHLKLSFQSA